MEYTYIALEVDCIARMTIKMTIVGHTEYTFIPCIDTILEYI
jgi:hypothetical protein